MHSPILVIINLYKYFELTQPAFSARYLVENNLLFFIDNIVSNTLSR